MSKLYVNMELIIHKRKWIFEYPKLLTHMYKKLSWGFLRNMSNESNSHMLLNTTYFNMFH